jgi:leader peptidase (prepilin peptidase)/N-methyltransferase
MAAGLLLSLLIGWLIGVIANWLADQLPHLPERPLHFDRRQYLPTLWLSLPQGVTAPETRYWRRVLLTTSMALAFAIGWWCFGADWGQVGVAWFYTAWLLLVVVIDFEYRRVLNRRLPPAIVVALVAALLAWMRVATLPSFTSILLGGLAGFGVFLVVFVIGRGRMMGAGDVKLAGVIGLMTGYPLVWIALGAGIVLGGIAAIFLIVGRRAGAKSYMAYGPYLALGALLILWLYWP